MFTVSVEKLFRWFDKQVNYGGDQESLYMLLDLLGGLSKKEFNSLKLNPNQNVRLNKSLDIITNSWIDHINTSRPVQYIAGSTYWRDLKLTINSSVLIPRPETELIVDIANDIFQSNDEEKYFADLGTGTGAIAIALALAHPNWLGFATDLDEEVLAIAKNNFMSLSNSSNLFFYLGDWWKAFDQFSGKFDLIVANPPYIPSNVYESLSGNVKNFEPKLALCGGIDGLDSIKKIINGSPEFLNKDGWIIIENHFDQGEKVKYILNKCGFNSVRIINDFSGIGRFTIGRYK